MKRNILHLCAAAMVLLYSCGGDGTSSTMDTADNSSTKASKEDCKIPEPCDPCDVACQTAMVCYHKINKETFDNMKINKGVENQGTVISVDSMAKMLSKCDAEKPVYVLAEDTTPNTDSNIIITVVPATGVVVTQNVAVVYTEALMRGILKEGASSFHFYNAKRLAAPFADDIIFSVSFSGGAPDEYYDLSDLPPDPQPASGTTKAK